MSDPPPQRAARLNRFAAAAKASGIRRVADLVSARTRDALVVYPFHLGEPDFDTPGPIKAATIRALEEGHVHYPPNAGIPALRAAIAADLRRRSGRPVEASDVVVTVGACEALTMAFMATLEPGDEVVVATPCWPNYLQTPLLLGAHVRQVPMDSGDGFRLDPARLLAAIGPSTRALVVNSPSNPTGAVADRDKLSALVAGARSAGVWLIVDEIYHDIVYDADWCSVLEVAAPDDPVIYVNGFSKSYAMTGWRVGYAVAAGEAGLALQRVHQALVTSVNAFVQYGALAALEQADEAASMRATYAARRTRVLRALEHAGLDVVAPAGAFYVFPRVPSGWGSGEDFAEAMLTEHGVAVVPGSVFGDGFADRFRLCFACADGLLDEGLDVLAEALRRR